MAGAELLPLHCSYMTLNYSVIAAIEMNASQKIVRKMGYSSMKRYTLC